MTEQQEINAEITLDRDDLYNLLDGIGVPHGGIEGLSVFSGNQWNEGWEWDRRALQGLTDPMLWIMYQKLKADKIKSAIILARPKIHLVGKGAGA